MTERRRSPAEAVVRERVAVFLQANEVRGDGGSRIYASIPGYRPPECADAADWFGLQLEALVMECVGRLRLGDDT